MSNELLPCPFCGGEGRWNWNKDYILCSSCDIAVRPSIWNTRPAPSTRMADVRLGAEAALKAVKECTERVECGDFQHGDSGYDIYEVGKLDPARIAATVTLPDAKKCEADRGIDWYAAYERMAHNRNELWAKLKAVEAALAHKEGR